MHVAPSFIDALPQAERSKVLDRIMNGESNSSIARSLGIHPSTVANYKKRVVHPALRTATQIASVQRNGSECRVLTSQDADTAKQIVISSPFQERLRATWERIERTLDRAENAVQVTEDGDPVGEDLAILAPLLNQAHKNLELLGKASGELMDKAAAPSIAIQVVVPASTIARPANHDFDPEGAIDVGSAEIGLK